MDSIFGLQDLTTDEIPAQKPCFALIFDFPYEVKYPSEPGGLQGHSGPHVPLLLGESEKYELQIRFESWMRLSRAYGDKDKWVGKPIMLEVQNGKIQCYPMKICKLRYNWSLRDSLYNLRCEIRCWIYMHITHRNE